MIGYVLTAGICKILQLVWSELTGSKTNLSTLLSLCSWALWIFYSKGIVSSIMMIDFELLFRAQDQGSAELKECQEESWCLLFWSTDKNHNKSSKTGHWHLWRMRSTELGHQVQIIALQLLSICWRVSYLSLLPQRVHLEWLFAPATNIVFVWESIKKCIKDEFHCFNIPLGGL